MNTLAGARDSLAAINTAQVSDRGLVVVKENNSLYVLHRESTVAPSGDEIVAPTAGPGRWFKYAPGGDVTSVFGRTGAVVAEEGDYDSDLVTNVSGVPGLRVSDALDFLLASAGSSGELVAGPDLTDADQTLDPDELSQYSAADTLLSQNRQKTIDPTNMATQQGVVIRCGQQGFTMAIINGGPGGGTLYTFPADGVRREAVFMLDLSGNVILAGVYFITAFT